MQKPPLATWSPASSAWLTQESHLCGHSVVFSETWPSSGMTLRGRAYALPMWEPPTDAGGSSFSHGLLRTPTAQLAVNGGSQHPDKRIAGGHSPTLADQAEWLLAPK